MKRKLVFLTIYIMLAGLLTGLPGCAGVRSPANARFTIQVSGLPGTRFSGFCTHEVKYIMGSRTEATEVNGTIAAGGEFREFVVPGTEISVRLISETPGKPLTIVLRKDGQEVRRVNSENRQIDFYLDYYPHKG